MPHDEPPATRNAIDAVVTWVDGADPRIVHAMQRSVERDDAGSWTRVPSSMGTQRFRDNGEVEFCIRGIRRMMPWIKTIFLVTADQVPRFLGTSEARDLGVTLVPHRTIFEGFEDVLPTFNTRTIESVLHRIPGLAEKFVYFNDDLIPIGSIDHRDFFIDDRIVLRGRWKRLRHQGIARTAFHVGRLRMLARTSKRDRSGHALGQMRAAELAGARGRYFHGSHSPHPMKKATLGAFFLEHPETLARNIQYRFRDLTQFNPWALSHHLEIRAGSYVALDEDDSATIHFGHPEEIDGALSLMQSPDIKFVCLQSLGCAPEKTRRDILDFLRERIG